MRKHNRFLAHQIARFGAMTIPQMQMACAGKCGRATLYRMVDDLLDLGFIKRVPHIGESKFLFSPRPLLYPEIYGREIKRTMGLSETSVLHAAAVAEVLLQLSKYSYVSGMATEHEMDSSEMSKFCYSRNPDAILQITNESDTFEIAVEVERVRKSESRVEHIIENYQQTFIKGMPCAGLLVVAHDKALAELYQNKITKLPPGSGKHYLVTTMNELSSLNEKFFGKYNDCPQGSLEKLGIRSHDSSAFIGFFPMISEERFLSDTHV